MRRLAFMAMSFLGLLIFAATAGAGPLDSPGAQKSLVCSACHGFAGNTPGQHMPVLAGMNANYFKKAIKDYAQGKRPSPEMEPYSKYVLQFGLDEIADYFASQKKPAFANVKVAAKALSRGATLASQCIACHGPKGDGESERVIPGPCADNPRAFSRLKWRCSPAISANWKSPNWQKPKSLASKDSTKPTSPTWRRITQR
ncbi:MAG: c-type cytochrome [Candidatus Binatia bacterium]